MEDENTFETANSKFAFKVFPKENTFIECTRDKKKSLITGDGSVSFEEFVEIVSNIGGSASSSSPTDQEQEEQELRDAFRVSCSFSAFVIRLSEITRVSDASMPRMKSN